MIIKSRQNLIIHDSFEIDNPLHTREQIEAKFREFSQVGKSSDNGFKSFGDTPRTTISRMNTVSSIGFTSPKTQRLLLNSHRGDQRLKSSGFGSTIKKQENFEILTDKDIDVRGKLLIHSKTIKGSKNFSGIQWNLYDEHTLRYKLYF